MFFSKRKISSAITYALALSCLPLTSLQARPPSAKVDLQPVNDQEAFLVRRIAEFWKDGDYKIVKSQIKEFFQAYPQSSLKSYFEGILGDLYLQEKKYEKAIATYESISQQDIYEKVLLNKLQCYYELDEYDKILEEGKPYQGKSIAGIQGRESEFHFLLAEALFRTALKVEEHGEKASLAFEAKGLYESLEDSKFQDVSLFALAEIYNILDNLPKSSELYLELADRYPSQQEDLLFQAAAIQAVYDPALAIKTFQKISEEEGKRAFEANINLIVLMFHEGQYEKIISKYLEFNSQEILASLPEDFLATLNFVVGKSYYELENYQDSLTPLEAYIASQPKPSPQLKNALLMCMASASKMQNRELFTKKLEQFQTHYPSDSELPKALFMKAMLDKQEELYEDAFTTLSEIKEGFPDFEDQEALFFELGHVAYQSEKYLKSHDNFKIYTSRFEDSERIDQSWRFFLSSCIQLYKELQDDAETLYTHSEFYSDLLSVLNREHLLDHNEIQDYHLLAGKIAFKIENYSDALNYLNNYILNAMDHKENPEALADAHYFAALSHQKLEGKPSTFTMHLENALKLNKEVYDNATTHLQLFNAFLALSDLEGGGASNITEEQSREYIHHAAKHLYRAFTYKSHPLKNSNLLWLANYYYEDVNTFLERNWRESITDHPKIAKYYKRAKGIYESLLLDPSSNELISFNETSLMLEPEVFKLNRLLEAEKKDQERLSLLENLLEQQSSHPEYPWKHKNYALLELGNIYEQLGDAPRAQETYDYLLKQEKDLSMDVVNKLNFSSAKLKFASLSQEEITSDSHDVQDVLSHLKEIQIRKHPQTEPLHLEAGLEYARIRYTLAKEEEKEDRYLFFLARLKEDFLESSPESHKEYFELLKTTPEKEHLIKNYLKYIEGEIARTKAKKCFIENRLEECEELNELALGYYHEVKEDEATPKELYSRTIAGIEAINRLNTY